MVLNMTMIYKYDITFSVPINEELEIIRQLQTKYDLLAALDLCQAHYQVLLIISLKDFVLVNAQIVSLVLNTYQP